MPFITKERREAIDAGTLAAFEPGDRCYIHYKRLIQQWNENPRWTTAHRLYKERYVLSDYSDDDDTACELAWQVFFQLHVMPYEIQKREENGEVE
jgi:hypothetical protein